MSVHNFAVIYSNVTYLLRRYIERDSAKVHFDVMVCTGYDEEKTFLQNSIAEYFF